MFSTDCLHSAFKTKKLHPSYLPLSTASGTVFASEQDIELNDLQPLSEALINDKDIAKRIRNRLNVMKFSHSLHFNAVPEWASKYINYSSLKKIAYNLQRQYVQELNDKSLDEEIQFTSDPNDPKNPIVVFSNALDKEAEKINRFFQQQQEELYSEYDSVLREFLEFEIDFPQNEGDAPVREKLRRILKELVVDYDEQVKEYSHAQSQETVGEEVDMDLRDDSMSPQVSPYSPSPPAAAGDSNINAVLDDEESLKLQKKRTFTTLFYDDDFHVTFLEALKVEKKQSLSRVFSNLSELKSYIELNKIGFGKALKKFDKLLQTSLKKDYLKKLETDYYVFRQSTFDDLSGKINNIVKLYSLFTRGNEEEAKIELGTNLREKVVFERNTVWRDMIGMERKSQAAYAKPINASLESKPWRIKLGAGREIVIPKAISSVKSIKLLIITIITIILLNKSPFDDLQQKNCFAVLICSSLLWASEAIPLFTTSLVLPFLLVILNVLKDPVTGEVLNAPDASKFICSAMWSPIILLLLGGFTLAAALSKHNLDKYACTFLLSKVKQKPAPILFAIMTVSTLVSAFVSNVAAPVLMYSVVQPILNTLNDTTINGKSVKNQFAQALVLGIALSSSIAGMASPIASPQNVVGLQFMDPQPNWLQWFAVSIPVCACCLVIIFGVLRLAFKFKDVTIIPINQHSDDFNSQQYFVIAVTFVTILLWCLASVLEPVFGDMGQIALLSMVTFYATGCLSQEDFNNYPWTIVILAMGGLALGKAVTVSGLLATIAQLIQQKLKNSEMFTILAVFGFIVLIMATFVSHTVAALIIVPLIAEIGRALPDPHPNILVFATALICSCAMGLPTSGFPNVTAIGLTNNVGEKYLDVGTFIRIGVPTSIACCTVVITVGYLCMSLIGV